MEWKGEKSTLLSAVVQQGRTKALTSHLFTPLFMFIHLPALIYFAPPPRLLIDFKNSKWLTYFCILLCISYCISHLIDLLSVTWLSLLYKFTRFSIYFLFLSDEGPMLETLDYIIRIGSTPTFLYFDLYLYSAYAVHFVYQTDRQTDKYTNKQIYKQTNKQADKQVNKQTNRQTRK